MKSKVKPTWQRYWSTILREEHEYEVIVCPDGTWEIVDLEFGGDVKRKGKSVSLDEAKRDALGSLSRLVEWVELAKWTQGKWHAEVRPPWVGHGSYFWVASRGLKPRGAIYREGVAETLKAAKAASERALEVLAALSLDAATTESREG